MDHERIPDQQRICDLESENQQLKRQLASVQQALQEANQAIRDSQEQLEQSSQAEQFARLVLNHMPEAAFWKDRQSVYLGCNQDFARAVGLASPAQIIGKTDYDLPWKPKEADGLRECDRRIMESDTAEIGIVEPQQQADGSQRWLKTNKMPLYDDQGAVVGVLGTFTDVTDRVAAEAQSTQQTIAMEETADGIGILTDAGFIYVNSAHVHLFGYDTADELLGQSWQILYGADERTRIEQEIMPWVMEQGSWQGELVAQRKDGSSFIQALTLNLTEGGTFICIFRDITEQKQAKVALQHLNETLEQRVEARTQELMASKAQLQRLAANLPGVIFQYRLEADGTHTFPYVSEGSHAIYELSPDRFLEAFQLVHPDDRNGLQHAIPTSVQSLEGFQSEHRIVTPSGILKWVQVIARPEHHSDGAIVWDGITIDVSDRQRLDIERQQAEQAKRESETQYQQILDSITDMVLVKREKSRIVWANQAFRDYYGMSNAELRNLIDASFNDPDYTQQYVRDDAYVFESGQTLEIEEPVTRHDGEIREFSTIKSALCNEAGNIAWTVGVSRDVTDRKRMEADLRLSEARLAAAFEQAAVGFAETDLQTGKIRLVNTHFCEMTGYTQAELCTMTVAELIHPDDRSASKQAMQRLFSEQIDHFTLEKRYLRKDGSILWAETTVYLVQPPHGQATYSMALVQDIRDRKAAEDLLKGSEAKFRTLVVQKTFQHLSQSHHENLITLLNSMRCSKASRFR
ncbi:MAG: PAS domain S-box protein [Leptolyngbyaceae cyanobacterium]